MRFPIPLTFLLVMMISPAFQHDNIYKIQRTGRSQINEGKLKELANVLVSPKCVKDAFKLQTKLANKHISEDEMKLIEYLLDYPSICKILPSLHGIIDEPIPSSEPIKHFVESSQTNTSHKYLDRIMKTLLKFSNEKQPQKEPTINSNYDDILIKDPEHSETKQLNDNGAQDGGHDLTSGDTFDTPKENNNSNEIKNILSNTFDDEIKENISNNSEKNDSGQTQPDKTNKNEEKGYESYRSSEKSLPEEQFENTETNIAPKTQELANGDKVERGGDSFDNFAEKFKNNHKGKMPGNEDLSKTTPHGFESKFTDAIKGAEQTADNQTVEDDLVVQNSNFDLSILQKEEESKATGIKQTHESKTNGSVAQDYEITEQEIGPLSVTPLKSKNRHVNKLHKIKVKAPSDEQNLTKHLHQEDIHSKNSFTVSDLLPSTFSTFKNDTSDLEFNNTKHAILKTAELTNVTFNENINKDLNENKNHLSHLLHEFVAVDIIPTHISPFDTSQNNTTHVNIVIKDPVKIYTERDGKISEKDVLNNENSYATLIESENHKDVLTKINATHANSDIKTHLDEKTVTRHDLLENGAGRNVKLPGIYVRSENLTDDSKISSRTDNLAVVENVDNSNQEYKHTNNKVKKIFPSRRFLGEKSTENNNNSEKINPITLEDEKKDNSTTNESDTYTFESTTIRSEIRKEILSDFIENGHVAHESPSVILEILDNSNQRRGRGKEEAILNMEAFAENPEEFGEDITQNENKQGTNEDLRNNIREEGLEDDKEHPEGLEHAGKFKQTHTQVTEGFLYGDNNENNNNSKKIHSLTLEDENLEDNSMKNDSDTYNLKIREESTSDITDEGQMNKIGQMIDIDGLDSTSQSENDKDDMDEFAESPEQFEGDSIQNENNEEQTNENQDLQNNIRKDGLDIKTSTSKTLSTPKKEPPDISTDRSIVILKTHKHEKPIPEVHHVGNSETVDLQNNIRKGGLQIKTSTSTATNTPKEKEQPDISTDRSMTISETTSKHEKPIPEVDHGGNSETVQLQNRFDDSESKPREEEATDTLDAQRNDKHGKYNPTARKELQENYKHSEHKIGTLELHSQEENPADNIENLPTFIYEKDENKQNDDDTRMLANEAHKQRKEATAKKIKFLEDLLKRKTQLKSKGTTDTVKASIMTPEIHRSDVDEGNLKEDKHGEEETSSNHHRGKHGHDETQENGENPDQEHTRKRKSKNQHHDIKENTDKLSDIQINVERPKSVHHTHIKIRNPHSFVNVPHEIPQSRRRPKSSTRVHYPKQPLPHSENQKIDDVSTKRITIHSPHEYKNTRPETPEEITSHPADEIVGGHNKYDHEDTEITQVYTEDEEDATPPNIFLSVEKHNQRTDPEEFELEENAKFGVQYNNEEDKELLDVSSDDEDNAETQVEFQIDGGQHKRHPDFSEYNKVNSERHITSQVEPENKVISHSHEDYHQDKEDPAFQNEKEEILILDKYRKKDGRSYIEPLITYEDTHRSLDDFNYDRNEKRSQALQNEPYFGNDYEEYNEKSSELSTQNEEEEEEEEDADLPPFEPNDNEKIEKKRIVYIERNKKPDMLVLPKHDSAKYDQKEESVHISSPFLHVFAEEDSTRQKENEDKRKVPERFRYLHKSHQSNKHLHAHKYLNLDELEEYEHKTPKEVTRRHSTIHQPETGSPEELASMAPAKPQKKEEKKLKKHRKYKMEQQLSNIKPELMHLNNKHTTISNEKSLEEGIHINRKSKVDSKRIQPYIYIKHKSEKYQFVGKATPNDITPKNAITDPETKTYKTQLNEENAPTSEKNTRSRRYKKVKQYQNDSS